MDTERHILLNPQEFILAGNATFTIVSKKTGVRFTYKVRQAEDDGQKKPLWFVGVLTGQDNESDYSYLGLLRGGMKFEHGRKSKISSSAPSARAIDWIVPHWEAGKTEVPGVEIWHEGRCGRCGRKLTVPESIERGFGPECATHM